MARTRSLKPSFFTDSDLAAYPPLHRIAFEGLWCHADRDGRLEEKVAELKVKILPFDECDFGRILADLAQPKGDDPGFIQRYQAGKRRFIQITKWDHQHPHKDEPSLNLPAPPEWVTPQEDAGTGQPGASTEAAPKSHGASLPVSCFLSLGSGSLVSGAGNAGASTSSTDSIRSMDSISVPAVEAGAVPDRRQDPNRPWADKPEPVPIAATVTAPTTDPDTWTGRDFWAWAQDVRRNSGLLAEKPPNPRKLGDWYSGALMTEGVTVNALKEGFYRFGQSKHWESGDPPYPFRAFMSQWEQFTRPEVARASAYAG